MAKIVISRITHYGQARAILTSLLSYRQSNTNTVLYSLQVDNINKHVLRLRQLAVAAKAAGDAEDYAMDAGNEGEAPARDPASLQRVEQVHVTSVEIDRMTPQLITAAKVDDNT